MTTVEPCETCMTAVSRWIADARRGYAGPSEWRGLATVVRQLRDRHLAISHPPALPEGYTSLGREYLIDTYENALEELARHV